MVGALALAGLRHKGYHQLCLRSRITDPFGEDADHRAGNTVKLKRATDYLRVGGITSLPQTVTEKRHRLCSGFAFRFQKGASEDGLDAQERVEVSRDTRAHDTLRLSRLSEIKCRHPYGGQLLEDPVLLFPVIQLG